MRLGAIGIHPVKSTSIRPVCRATVRRWGLEGDRRWMVVTTDGVLLTAREDARLFGLVADTPATDPGVTNALRLKATGRPELADLLLDEPSGEAVPVQLHRHRLDAVPVAPEADRWLRSALGRDDVRLVWCDDPTRRSLNPDYGRPGDHTAFADGYPVTLASTTSLDQLNAWIAQNALERGEEVPAPLPMRRFRPNLVVDGAAEAFAEDNWRRLRIGGATFRVAKAVDRCVMTSINPADLSRGKEPIRTLARHRRWDGTTWFAMQMIPEETGVLAVGDEVTVLR